MSFGRPPSFTSFTVLPPERGSFPLDHEGECQLAMKTYLKCLRSNGNDNGKCRELSKAYLDCRMNRGLMERDEWKNLGFADTPATGAVGNVNGEAAAAGDASSNRSSRTG
ncbi:hypothetical protein BOTBODRAFT_32278 [Botryobasidium botryosum FD-172 SS1]|uniref:Cytochrome c oxidase assembly protein COX19 n=1 Tax=Botryobasidium botryosum (strain FD-172 SS1) TaxID=930990 RepID=A0A067MSU7_BOTB1|nr:hypothetical protein BOTBODRAFT_32278 [Botryobasidium botryosum FD-172 SS1]